MPSCNAGGQRSFSSLPKKKNCLTGTPYSSSESRKLATVTGAILAANVEYV